MGRGGQSGQDRGERKRGVPVRKAAAGHPEETGVPGRDQPGLGQEEPLCPRPLNEPGPV